MNDMMVIGTEHKPTMVLGGEKDAPKTLVLGNKNMGSEEVYETGKNFQYNKFWDDYQQKGTLKLYNNAFSGRGWTKDTFKPKYSIRPTNAYHMFYYGGANCNIDMVELSEELGIEFDFSGTTNFYQAFVGDFFKRLGVIDTRSASSLNGMLVEFGGETIDKLIIKSNGTTTCGTSFSLAKNLRNITIEGVIGKDWDMLYCPLSKDSLISVVNALSTTKQGLTVTFSMAAVEAAYGSVESEEWLALIATKPNWTFVLS